MRGNAKFAIRELSLWYGTHRALEGINMDIAAGAVTAFIGPSGCGKSSLLVCLNRLSALVDGCRVEGQILLDGGEIGGLDDNVLRRRVGMVFQKPNPFPMSIYDNVAYGPRTHGERRRGALDEAVERALRGAALWDEVKDRLRRPALGLSGGQQQRLCIARALAVEPEVLLMDEPTSALDPISTAAVEDLILTFRPRCTVVLVTHNMQQALRVADRTAFFAAGRLIEHDETARLFARPTDRRTEAYITGRM